MENTSQYLQLFAKAPNRDWAFSGQKSTNRYTHGYHRYPAKFLPNLVKKLIEDYTTEGDLIADVFAGCGTTLLESKLHGRPSIGVDINPVALMITRAKTVAINPETLENYTQKFLAKLKQFNPSTKYYPKTKHPRINYWFREKEKNKIAFLYRRVRYVRDSQLRDFYLCALSNTLKPCSRWLQSGTKPQLDPSRADNIADPFKQFAYQVGQMQKRNRELFEELLVNGYADVDCKIKDADARQTGK